MLHETHQHTLEDVTKQKKKMRVNLTIKHFRLLSLISIHLTSCVALAFEG